MSAGSKLAPDTALLPRRAGEERPLIVIMAIMTCLAGVTLLLTISGLRTSQSWQAENARAMTVQLLLDAPNDAVVSKAKDIISATMPGAKTSLVEPSEARELLGPWIGDIDLPEDLPLPVLLKVKLASDAPVDTDVLTQAFSRAKIETMIDDHSRWRGDIRRTWQTVRTAMGGVILLVMIASGAIISYATRSVLRARQSIINVLIQVGAPDGYILRLFTARFFALALKAAILGGLLALSALIIFSAKTKTTAADILPHTGLHFSDLVWLAGLMFVMAMISALTAVMTTRRLLNLDRQSS